MMCIAAQQQEDHRTNYVSTFIHPLPPSICPPRSCFLHFSRSFLLFAARKLSDQIRKETQKINDRHKTMRRREREKANQKGHSKPRAKRAYTDSRSFSSYSCSGSACSGKGGDLESVNRTGNHIKWQSNMISDNSMKSIQKCNQNEQMKSISQLTAKLQTIFRINDFFLSTNIPPKCPKNANQKTKQNQPISTVTTRIILRMSSCHLPYLCHQNHTVHSLYIRM